MDNNLKKWLEENPPKIELTELEKNFKFDEKDKKKYVHYLERDGDDYIFRVRKYEFLERIIYSKIMKWEEESAYRSLCAKQKLYGFNILGYSIAELNEVNRKFDLFTEIY